MKISVIGAGYVGLVAATCFASFGLKVTCIDTSVDKINKLSIGEIPIYEPSLKELLFSAIEKQNIHFTTNYESIESSDAVIIAVGTPSAYDGSADLSYVYNSLTLIMDIVDKLKKHILVVTKSTVPIGTAKKLMQLVRERSLDSYISIVSNPEFLREGSAVLDFLKPDRIVLGASSKEALTVAKGMYESLISQGTKVVETDNATAELIKYAANSYLAMRIAFINECADLAEHCGANIDDAALGIGLDSRIGTHYFAPGPAYGGSCFPKDTKALQFYSHSNDLDIKIVDAVISSNNARREKLARRAVSLFAEYQCKTIAVLGVTFKANTDDMRDAASISIVGSLKAAGFIVKLYDPSFSKEAEDILNQHLEQNIEAALADADGAIILTEWDQFKALDLGHLSSSLAKKVLIDYRNLYNVNQAIEHGLEYYSLGRIHLDKHS